LNGPAIVGHLWETEISSSRQSPHLNWLRDVEYVPNPLEIPWAEYREAKPQDVGVTLLYTKLDDFSFEQEWRFTIFDCIKQSIGFPEEIVEEVFFGPNTTDGQKKRLVEWNNSRSLQYAINEAHIQS